jgi:hypothetical protein
MPTAVAGVPFFIDAAAAEYFATYLGVLSAFYSAGFAYRTRPFGATSRSKSLNDGR